MADKPGKGVLFVTPVKGKRTLEKATQAGFHPTHQVATLKVEGTNGKGVGARITEAIGKAGVSMRGLSGAVIGKKFVCYIGFDNAEALAKAKKALAAVK
jgi:hypothetical protein